MVTRGRLRAGLGIALFGAIVLTALLLGPERAIDTLLQLGESPWLLPLLLVLDRKSVV